MSGGIKGPGPYLIGPVRGVGFGMPLMLCVTAVTPATGALAQAQSSSFTPGATTNPLPAEYRINAGDELEISVWGEERMQRIVRVLPDGTFAFPLAGTIKALGQTVSEVSTAIRQRIANNYRSGPPDVTVGVRTAIATSFFVVGRVRTPGVYSSGRDVNVVQALSMAGGLADFADVKHAVILRQSPGGQVVEPVALSRVLKGGRRLDRGALTKPLPILRSGDVLVIP